MTDHTKDEEADCAELTPAREAWLYENEKALGLLRAGLVQARDRKFSDRPPDLEAGSHS